MAYEVKGKKVIYNDETVRVGSGDFTIPKPADNQIRILTMTDNSGVNNTRWYVSW